MPAVCDIVMPALKRQQRPYQGAESRDVSVAIYLGVLISYSSEVGKLELKQHIPSVMTAN